MLNFAARAMLVAVTAVSAAVVLTGCQQGGLDAFPAGSRPATAATASPAPAPSAPVASEPAPSIPAAAPPGSPLPATCETSVSAAMRTTLGTDLGPLNAPGFELLSTANGSALDMLSTAPTLRCTWGIPGENGLATNLSAITEEQRVALLDAFRSAGYSCADASGGVLCSFEQRSVTLDDELIVRGEVQYVEPDRWISTAWVGANPAGYTEDLIAQHWG